MKFKAVYIFLVYRTPLILQFFRFIPWAGSRGGLGLAIAWATNGKGLQCVKLIVG
jgi:hypothetical protein